MPASKTEFTRDMSIFTKKDLKGVGQEKLQGVAKLHNLFLSD